MKLRVLILDTIGCHYVGQHEHPQVQMKNLGITYQQATPQSIADCWWFWNCENVPDVLPEYFRWQEIDPMGCIGYGLSLTMAEKIRDYKKQKE